MDLTFRMSRSNIAHVTNKLLFFPGVRNSQKFCRIYHGPNITILFRCWDSIRSFSLTRVLFSISHLVRYTAPTPFDFTSRFLWPSISFSTWTLLYTGVMSVRLRSTRRVDYMILAYIILPCFGEWHWEGWVLWWSVRREVEVGVDDTMMKVWLFVIFGLQSWSRSVWSMERWHS